MRAFVLGLFPLVFLAACTRQAPQAQQPSSCGCAVAPPAAQPSDPPPPSPTQWSRAQPDD